MKFNIRDLFWLTAVVAVALGMGMAWWADHYAFTPNDRRLLVKAANDAGYYFDLNETGSGFKMLPYPKR